MNFTLATILLTHFFSFSASANQKWKVPIRDHQRQRFEVDYQWSFVNFTWTSPEAYQNAIDTKQYVPQNIAIAGIKYYKDKFYLAIPRICPGTPVTLGYIDFGEKTLKMNRLVTPFPNWETNDLTSHTCDKLENVQSMEIDANGVMWVLDGFRAAPDSKCPPKLVLYDLNTSKTIHSYDFPEEIVLSKGGFLNDIVVDETGGGYAYITDASSIDPGLIVYSRSQDSSWKLRDPSMFAQLLANNFVVDNVMVSSPVPIDGIALSRKGDKSRKVYYCSLTGLDLYSIDTDVLKDENQASGGNWRYNVTRVGRKEAQSDGLVVDNENNLYYGLLTLYGVGKWDTGKPFSTRKIVDENRNTMIWTDSFSFDDKGYLYLLTNQIHKYFNSDCNFAPPKDTKFRILKYYTGTQSYLY